MIKIDRDGLTLTYDEATHIPKAVFSNGVVVSLVAEPIQQPVATVPAEISRAKGIIICKKYGIYDAILAVVAAKNAQEVATLGYGISQDKFDEATTFGRQDELLLYVAGLIPLTDIELDQMFIEGEALWP